MRNLKRRVQDLATSAYPFCPPRVDPQNQRLTIFLVSLRSIVVARKRLAVIPYRILFADTIFISSVGKSEARTRKNSIPGSDKSARLLSSFKKRRSPCDMFFTFFKPLVVWCLCASELQSACVEERRKSEPATALRWSIVVAKENVDASPD